MGAHINESALVAENLVLLGGEVSEAPLVAGDDVLTAGEFVLGTAQSLQSVSLVGSLGADGDELLADINTGNLAGGLSEGTWCETR